MTVRFMVAVRLTLLGGSIAAPGSLAAQAARSYLVVVHPPNSVGELRRAEIKDYFLKRRSEWGPARPVMPVDLSPKLPARTAFSEEILGLSARAVTNYWIQEIFAGTKAPPVVLTTVAAMVAYVAAYPGAIGYIPSDAPAEGVKIVKVVP